MKVTVVYDNDVYKAGLKEGWGFSAYIKNEHTPSILFDAGADGPTLLHNMNVLGIAPETLRIIVISHAHGDHTGGLSDILRLNKTAELFLPNSFKGTFPGRRITIVQEDTVQICENVFSTGEIEAIEQALVLRTKKGIFVLPGCSHPAMKSILGAASKIGELYGIAGGFHGFHDFEAFKGLSLIYPCHCTMHKKEIRSFYKSKVMACGAGLEIEL